MGYSDDILTDGAALVWRFDETLTAGQDTFTAENDGTHSGTITENASYTTGFAAATALFGDETDTKAITFGVTANPAAHPTGSANLGTGDGNIAIEFVFSPNSTTPAVDLITLTGGSSKEIRIGHDEVNDRLTVDFDHGSVSTITTSNNSIQADGLYHIWVEWQSGVPFNYARVYINGDQDGASLPGGVFTYSATSALTVTTQGQGVIQALAIYKAATGSTYASDHYDATVGSFVSPSIPLEWVTEKREPFILLEWTGYQTEQISVPIEWQLPTAQPRIPLEWYNRYTNQISVPIAWVAPDLSVFPETTQTWTPAVYIDGTDYSARLTGVISIDTEEDSSTLANFSIHPATGTLDPLSYIGRLVWIDITTDSDTIRKFRGVVSNAVYNPDTGLMAFTCTNDLQGYFENATRTEIDSVIGGYWSEFVFASYGDESHGWKYATDRLSTQFKALHLDVNGNPVLTSLTAKPTADYTFTDAKRFNDTLSVSRATRRELLNRVRVLFDYRFTRLRQRHIYYEFVHAKQVGSSLTGLSQCDFLQDAYDLCEKAQIESAVENSGWLMYGTPDYLLPPGSGVYRCPGSQSPWSPQSGYSINWVFPESARQKTCFSARFTIAKRFAQTVTEQYVFDVRADDSIERVGELGIEERFGMETEYDATLWESEPFTSTADGATLDSSGDYVLDANDGDNGRTAFNNAQTTALAQAQVDIKKSHRQNRVSFEVPYHPLIDITHTARCESSYLTAQGKVRQVTHTFDTDTGEATTFIEIAISAHGGSGLVTDTALDPVTPPEQTIPDYTREFTIPYRMGGESDSEPYDEEWQGYLTNRASITGNYHRYDVAFKIETPAIDSAFRDAVEIPSTNTANVAIDQDTLTLSA